MNVTLIADLQGQSISESEKQWLVSPHLGGLILFTRNFSSRHQIANLIQEVKTLNPKLLITVDHEGGRVQRFRDGFTHVASMERIGNLSFETAKLAARAASIVIGYELKEIGVDLTYAPVLDLNYGNNQVIGDRSFSGDPNQVIELATAFMEGLRIMDMAVVGKHFPGHGWVTSDSHTASPIDERSYEEIKHSDLIPFSKLSDKLDWLMPAHVVYPKVCEEPAGFSSTWLRNVLKKELTYTGLIVSDDLSMAGAAVKGSYEQRANSAVAAGCDILLACNAPLAAISILSWLDRQKNEALSLKKYNPRNINEQDTNAYKDSIKILHEQGLITHER